MITQFGMPGIGNSIPVPGDYDNSGKPNRPSTSPPWVNSPIARPTEGPT